MIVKGQSALSILTWVQVTMASYVDYIPSLCSIRVSSGLFLALFWPCAFARPDAATEPLDLLNVVSPVLPFCAWLCHPHISYIKSVYISNEGFPL